MGVRSNETTAFRPDVRVLLERRVEQYPLVNLGKHRVRERHYRDPVTANEALISTASPRGLPGPLGADLYMGLCTLLNARMGGNGRTVPEDRAVETTYAELFDLLRMARGGDQDVRVQEALEDWHAVNIRWDVPETRRRGREPLALTRVIDNVHFLSDVADGPRTRIRVLFNVDVLASIADDRRSRYLVLDEYLRYTRPTSKRLFRFLDLLRYRGRRSADAPLETVSITAAELRNSLPLDTDKTTHLLRNLVGVHEELAQSGFLRDLPAVERQGRGAALTRLVYRITPPPAQVARSWREQDDPGYYDRTVKAMLVAVREPFERSGAFFMRCAKALPPDRIREQIADIEAERRTGGFGDPVLARVFTKRLSELLEPR